MTPASGNLLALAAALRQAAETQLEALRSSDTAALERAQNQFAALASRWDAAAPLASAVPPALRQQLTAQLEATAAALQTASSLAKARLAGLRAELQQAPRERERLLAYTRAMAGHFRHDSPSRSGANGGI